MTISTRFIGSAAAALAFALLLIFLAPRRGDAQYATPVRVTNSASAPAIGSSVDEPGRTPYISQVLVTSNNCVQFQTCSFSFPPVPAGHRLVVREVSGFAQLNPSTGPAALRAGVCYSQSLCETFQVPVIVNTNFNIDQADFNQHLLGYFDAGATPEVSFQGLNTSFPGAGVNEVATLKGYLLDC